MGFTGKVTIHPDQIPIVNEAFTPSEAERAEAQELLDAFVEAEAEGRMAFSFKGQMVDVPHLRRAQTIVDRAQPHVRAELSDHNGSSPAELVSPGRRSAAGLAERDAPLAAATHDHLRRRGLAPGSGRL